MTTYSYELGETILKAEGVTKAYGEILVLRDLSFEVKNIVRPGMTQGQVVALLGPSGVGKSTLFRILSGLEEPDAGVVLTHGTPVVKGEAGVVTQHYPLFAHRTVLSNLVLAAKLNPIQDESGKRLDPVDRAREMLRRFGLGEHAEKYPLHLSGGQRQRVAIAQQFLCSDDLLLMDEPFSGLDLIAQQNVIDLIEEIAAQSEHRTLIVVTHDVNAGLRVADTVWLIGRDRDADGNPVPGARIQESYNLAERGLAWRQPHEDMPAFQACRIEIRERFLTL